MPKVQRVAQSILDYNRGRDPEMLQRKFELLRADSYAFFRGTCHLFYQNLPRHAALATAPALLVCGDLHLENFGVYKGDNRLAYFDLSDFDEATLAPFTFDVLRFVSSIHVAATCGCPRGRRRGSANSSSTAIASGSLTARHAGSNGRRQTAWCAICSGA